LNKGIALIRKWEGLRLNAYLCGAGKATIGWGSTFYENGSRVQMGERITVERADRMLHLMCNMFNDAISKMVTSNINDNQRGALLSFVFNIGATQLRRSALLRKVNKNPNDPTIRNEFMRWINAGGKPSNGLRNRRKDEADLYFSVA
jgi:lysozyme